MAFTDDTTGGRIIKEGVGAIKITLSGSVSVGDLVGYSSGWKAADGNASVYAEFVAGQSGASGDVITAYRAARIGNLTTGTAGNPVYLSDTAGGYSASAGTVVQVVGHELGGGEIWVEPKKVPMEMLFRVVTKTDDYTVTHAESGCIFNNQGADGAVEFTLPTKKSGLFYIFSNVEDQDLTVTADAADTMVVFNDVAADSIAFSTSSEKIGGGFLVYCDGTNWIVHELIHDAQTATVST